MKHISELNKEILLSVKPKFTYNHHQSYYAEIPLAFDIETTSTYINENKFANMYVWAFGLADSVYYGRTWQEFVEFTELLSETWELTKYARAIIYVHNLGYEFQFMRKWFTWEKVFAVDERKPLKALTESGIEFRDSYILSGFNLAKTAENLTEHKIEKLVGDLDYSLIRHHETPITDTEWGYIENDIVIIINYIDEQINQYGSIAKIPLTNTGRVRDFTRSKCFNNDEGKRDNNKRRKYHNLMGNMVLTSDDYIQLKRAFMGGFTHASSLHSGKVLENVASIDFTSSYPSVMISEKFPMSSPKSVEVDSLAELENLMKNYCVVFDVRYKNIKSSIGYENYISESKTRNLINGVSNNGRIFSADNLETTITELDYNIIKNTYDYSEIYVSNVKTMYKGFLPKPIIDSVLELYQGKTELKGVKGKETEYLLSKGMLNSIYGMTVTDIAKDDHTYDTEWDVEPVDLEDVLNKHNKSKNRFLYYAWGVWVTAYARFNLWTGILAIGEDYVYSDTDSIKFLNPDNHQEYIEMYNQKLSEKQSKVIEHYDLNPELFKPKTIEGIEKPIGVWDFEGLYSRFKTLGAKRYLSEHENELEITIAGLSKKNGLRYMLNKSGSNTGVFRMFNNSLFIPKSDTGKNTHTYIDESKTVEIEDYLGNKATVTELSGVHLESAEFTLNISKDYQKFLSLLKEGFIWKGVQRG